MSAAKDLTHTYEEEVLMLNFKVKDLEAKLEDSTAMNQQDKQDDVSVVF